MGGRQPYSHPSLPLFYYSSASSPPSLGMLMEDKIGHRGIGWCLAQWLMSSLTHRALLPTSSPFSSLKLPQPPPRQSSSPALSFCCRRSSPSHRSHHHSSAHLPLTVSPPIVPLVEEFNSTVFTSYPLGAHQTTIIYEAVICLSRENTGPVIKSRGLRGYVAVVTKKMQEGKLDQEETEDHVFISGIGVLLSAFCKPLRNKSLKIIIESLSTHTNGKVGEMWVFHIKTVLQHSP